MGEPGPTPVPFHLVEQPGRAAGPDVAGGPIGADTGQLREGEAPGRAALAGVPFDQSQIRGPGGTLAQLGTEDDVVGGGRGSTSSTSGAP